MEKSSSNPYMRTTVWREKEGWAYKIEERVGKWRKWEAHGYETKDAAEASMDERLKGLEGER